MACSACLNLVLANIKSTEFSKCYQLINVGALKDKVFSHNRNHFPFFHKFFLCLKTSESHFQYLCLKRMTP